MTEEELTGSPLGRDSDAIERNDRDDEYDDAGTAHVLAPDTEDDDAQSSGVDSPDA